MNAKEKYFYIMAKAEADLAVTIRATSKRAAMERLKNGSWDEVLDVTIRPIGSVHCEAQ